MRDDQHLIFRDHAMRQYTYHQSKVISVSFFSRRMATVLWVLLIFLLFIMFLFLSQLLPMIGDNT